jgi:hypothetical protein
LSLKKCSIGNLGAKEILASKNLRSLEILILRKNRIRDIEGPYNDLEDATKQQKEKEIMRL